MLSSALEVTVLDSINAYDIWISHLGVHLLFQVPPFPYFPSLQQRDANMLPIMYPALVPGIVSTQNLEQMNRGPGIYAVPVLPLNGTVTRVPTSALIPLTYSTPT